MIYFQFVFAAITPILIAGAVLGRMNFKAWMLFVPLWSTFVYTVGAFALWGGGWLPESARSTTRAAMSSIWRPVSRVSSPPPWLVRDCSQDRTSFDPEQPDHRARRRRSPLARLERLQRRRPVLRERRRGGGRPQHQHRDRGLAAGVARLRHVRDGQPNAVSMINGMIVGLVAITPAAGYVDGFGAMLTGGSRRSWSGSR